MDRKRLFDYASVRPDLDALKAAGVGVIRYVCELIGTKVITKEEADDIRAHGLGLALVYEQYEQRPLEGRAAGHADALVALAQGRAAGFPDGRPIYFAVDFDAQPAQQKAVDEYLGGAAEVLGIERVGVYGGFNLINRCWTNKTASFFWQTGAWSKGQESIHANMIQMTGINPQVIGNVKVDVNETRQDDFGAAFLSDTPRAISDAEKKCVRLKIVDPGHDPNGPVTWNTLWWTIFRLLAYLNK